MASSGDPRTVGNVAWSGSHVIGTMIVQHATQALRVCNAAGKARQMNVQVHLNGKLMEDVVPPEGCHEFLEPVKEGDMVALQFGQQGSLAIQAQKQALLNGPILYLVGYPVSAE